MSEEIGSIHYTLDLDSKTFNKNIKESSHSVNSFKDHLHTAARGAKALLIGLTAVAGAAGVFAYKSVKAFQESENMIAQTNAVLKSTGGIAGVTADEVTKLSRSLQKSTAYSDEQVRSAENMALTFTAIKKDIFPEVTKTALDMATALNHGVTPSGEEAADTMKLLGKALQDPDAGLGALKRVGVNTDELKKSFEGVNDVATKQKLILKELATEFGGSAASAAGTFQGKLQKLKNDFNDLQEKIGEVLVKALQPLVAWAVDDLVPALERAWDSKGMQNFRDNLKDVWDWIKNKLWPAFLDFLPTLKEWVTTGIDVLKAIANFIKDKVVPWFIKMGEKLKEAWDGWIYPALHAIGSFFKAVWDDIVYPIVKRVLGWWNMLSDSTKSNFGKIAVAIALPIIPIMQFIGWLDKLYQKHAWFRDVVSAIWFAITMPIKAFWAVAEGIFKVLVWNFENIMMPVFRLFGGIVAWAFDSMSDNLSKAWDVMQPVFSAIEWGVNKFIIAPFNAIVGTVQSVWGSVTDIIGGAIDKIISFFSKVWDLIPNEVKEMLGFTGAKYSSIGGTTGQVALKAGKAGGKTIYGPFQGNAAGGWLDKGDVSLVGEQGPEMFIPSTSGQIIDAQRTASLMAQAMDSNRVQDKGTQVIINVDMSKVMAVSRQQVREVGNTFIEAVNEGLIARGLAPIADNKIRSAQ